MTTEAKTQKKTESERIVRIASKDIEGGMTLYSGLTKIKGISWGVSNALCRILGFDKKRRVGSLTDKEVQTLNESIKKVNNLPKHLYNRKNDFETGADKHITGNDLELQHEFDVKRLKKIKSYKGIRHLTGQPLRGQRTKAHFRTNRRKGAGIKKKNKKPNETKA